MTRERIKEDEAYRIEGNQSKNVKNKHTKNNAHGRAGERKRQTAPRKEPEMAERNRLKREEEDIQKRKMQKNRKQLKKRKEESHQDDRRRHEKGQKERDQEEERKRIDWDK